MQCTLVDNQSDLSGVISMYASFLSVSNSIIAYNRSVAAIDVSGEVTISCTDIFANRGGDWGGLEEYEGLYGNLCEDPLFCDLEAGDLQLNTRSPCAPDVNPSCGLIGAYSVGCGGVPGCWEASWGSVKALFRGPPE